MIEVIVENFADWRDKARFFVQAETAPEDLVWCDAKDLQQSLLPQTATELLSQQSKPLFVSKEFLSLAKYVAVHVARDKWQLLYQALWRITHGEKHLFKIGSDDLVRRLMLMEKEVRRDMHKMKAFVRFKAYTHDQQTYYLAWHQPDHDIAQLVANFFVRRFKDMHWTIMTPTQTIQWDLQQLHILPGISRPPEGLHDDAEHLWQTYYRSIFNPARIKLKAMRKEMPIRYWHTLPEAKVISEILQEAPERVAAMVKHQEGYAQSAADFMPAKKDLTSLKQAAKVCKGCDLYRDASQTVFGAGAHQAEIMLVGEQPGDKEDLAGHPFVGPAGKLLHACIAEAGLDSDKIYYTNIVKHFKFVHQGPIRLHRSPNLHEVSACKPWLYAEIAAVQPKIIVCLGLTAAKGLISHGFKIKTQRGKIFELEGLPPMLATYHPSAILRAFDEETKQLYQRSLIQDLIAAKKAV